MKTVGSGLATALAFVACRNSADQSPHMAAEVPITTTSDANPSSTDSAASAGSSNDIPDLYRNSTLDNTSWDFCGTSTVVGFHPGGSIAFMGSSDRRRRQTCTDGRWTQSGDHVRFDCNGVTFFDVVITTPNTMGGSWHRADSPEEKFPTCLRKRGS
jgi:hypothetical protein